MLMDNEIQPWERQDGETDRQFEAFSIYRDMGADRGIRKVAQKLDKQPSYISKIASRWFWVDRVTKYDRYLDEKRRVEREAEIEKMNERHVKIGKTLQSKAIERLQTIDVSTFTPSELLRYVELGVKIERGAMGETDAEEAGAGKETSLDRLADSLSKIRQTAPAYNG